MSYAETMDARMFDYQDFYRTVAERMPEECRIAEVGIADGASAIFLAETLHALGKRFQLTLVDDFSYGGTKQKYEVMKHLIRSKMGEFCSLLPFDSLNASCHFPDHYFHFVFIDASHEYEPTKADIRLWWRKVIDGGILAGHDVVTCPDTRRAVFEVIPKDIIDEVTTTKSFGVWSVDKAPNIELK